MELLRKTVSGIMVILLFISMLTLAFNVKPVKSTWTGGTIYIRADGSIEPSDAPILTYDNISYYLTDDILSFADGIVIERDNIIVDGMGHKAISWYGEGNGVSINGRTNVTVRNLQISYFWRGIYAEDSSFISLYGNNITSNSEAGILMRGSHNNVVKNYIAHNRWGIEIGGSYNNISDNTMVSNQAGCNLWFSHNNVSRNIFINDGMLFLYSEDNVVVDNLVNGKPLIYLENVSNLTVSEEAGQVILIKSSNITVKDLDLSNTGVGIELWRTSGSKIYKNRISNNSIGIDIWGSNNHIFENNITNNAFGILFGYGSLHNKIYKNNIVKNGDPCLYANSGGISGSRCNDIFENYFSENIYGINYFSCNNNISVTLIAFKIS